MNSIKANGKKGKKVLSKDEPKKAEKSSTKVPRKKSTFKKSFLKENQN